MFGTPLFFDASTNIREFLRACIRLNSLDIRHNIYVAFGLLFGLGLPIALAIEEFVLGPGPPSLAEFRHVFLGEDMMGLGFAVPLLSAWIFGSMGTIRRDKEQSRLRTIEGLEQQVMSRTLGLRDMYVQTVLALSAAIEAKSPYTFGHSRRVWGYASVIAEEMGLPDEDLEALRFACYLHDIGKIRVPDSVLDKPGRLDASELLQVQQHPNVGATILAPITGFHRVASLVRMHHEREDGTGYPDGLTGDQIPPLAKILSVSDALDAMVSTRPYRAALTMAQGLAELQRCSGLPFDATQVPGGRTAPSHQFDPRVVEALEAALDHRGALCPPCPSPSSRERARTTPTSPGGFHPVDREARQNKPSRALVAAARLS